MVPLNKINDPDKVLLNKVVHEEKCVYLNTTGNKCCCSAKDVNNAIDQYNQLNIDGDVEKLSKELYMSTHSGTTEEYWEKMVDQDVFINQAHRLIANLDKFLIIRKGE